MNTQLVPGDKVRLISGGLEMTVRGAHYDVLANEYSDSMYDCIWFARNVDGKDAVHYCPFQAGELIKTKRV